MSKFLKLLGRYEAAEFRQLEAAKLAGVGERTFRRWRQRFADDGEAEPEGMRSLRRALRQMKPMINNPMGGRRYCRSVGRHSAACTVRAGV